MTFAVGPNACGTMACSVALYALPPIRARPATISTDSLAPDVKMTSWRQPSISAMLDRASSSSARDARPSAWGELGFAQAS
jgi:hypothetical protein